MGCTQIESNENCCIVLVPQLCSQASLIAIHYLLLAEIDKIVFIYAMYSILACYT